MRSANSNHRCCQCRSRPGMGVLAVSPPASGGEVGRRGPWCPAGLRRGGAARHRSAGQPRAGRLATWALARAAVHALSPARLQSGPVREVPGEHGVGHRIGVGGCGPRGEHGRAPPSRPIVAVVAEGHRGPPRASLTSGIGGEGQAEWVRKGEITCCSG